MKSLIILTGSAGHLGQALIDQLKNTNYQVRGLINRNPGKINAKNITYIKGNILKDEDLEKLFEDCETFYKVFVIHAASKITIDEEKMSEDTYNINVIGTKNLVKIATNHHVARFIYVSSSDIFYPESKLINENEPLTQKNITQGYQLSKLLATKLVLESISSEFDAKVVYPSGILGPFDEGNNHLVQMIKDYNQHKLPAIVKGGYDIVDVRDVAKAIVTLLEVETSHQSFLLTNHQESIYDILKTINILKGKPNKKIPVIPYWLAYFGAPFVKAFCKIIHKRVIYTKFALKTIQHANTFDNSLSRKELNFNPVNLTITVQDTLYYLNNLPNKKTEKK